MIDAHTRMTVGYHGCDPAFADRLIGGTLPVREWRPSANRYDWLGRGMYFWEYGQPRAREWVREGGAVVGAVIALGRCLDLTDIRYTRQLTEEYRRVRREFRDRGMPMPPNVGKMHDRDCLVINSLVTASWTTGAGFQTVRGAFLEGRPVFPGSRLRTETHIQVAVVDVSCIVGVFRPNLD